MARVAAVRLGVGGLHQLVGYGSVRARHLEATAAHGILLRLLVQAGPFHVVNLRFQRLVFLLIHLLIVLKIS